jgi:hypothetical protein
MMSLKKNDFHRKMVLFIIKPDKGVGFAAIITPGWIDGETGINEKGITVSQNNIEIRQEDWDVMPITILSRYMLQYSETIDDIDRVLDQQQAYPVRLIFVSNPHGASVFEFVNTENARINEPRFSCFIESRKGDSLPEVRWQFCEAAFNT